MKHFLVLLLLHLHTLCKQCRMQDKRWLSIEFLSLRCRVNVCARLCIWTQVHAWLYIRGHFKPHMQLWEEWIVLLSLFYVLSVQVLSIEEGETISYIEPNAQIAELVHSFVLKTQPGGHNTGRVYEFQARYHQMHGSMHAQQKVAVERLHWFKLLIAAHM